MVEPRIGFLEEFEERNYIRKELKNADWRKENVSYFIEKVRGIDEDMAEILSEKAEVLGTKEVEHAEVSIDGKMFDVFYDGKNYVVISDVGKFIRKNKKSKKKKSNEVVDVVVQGAGEKSDVSVKSVVEPDVSVEEQAPQHVESVAKPRKRGEKTRLILEYLDKYLQANKEAKIGPFYKYLREHGVEVHRPQVFNIVRKFCDIEYTQTKGGRKEIIIKGIRV